MDWKTGLVSGALIADHLDLDQDNNSPENLVPACIKCNGHRRQTGKSKLIEYGELVVETNKGPTRAVERECATCNKKFLAIPAQIRAGRGVYCSRDCMYNRNRPNKKGA